MMLQKIQQVSATINWGKMCLNTFMSGTCTQFASDQADQCISFTGSNSFWNDDISSIEVYSGNICDFYVDTGCTGSRQFMPAGVYNTVDYNDQYSSFQCQKD
ncbi:hypothetical protein K438DRAFT_1967338 [Mycena galopus ATCC 62051]|nr:hypothetical protein K438DRAFT_1967338 [Mycena galopus ATCC 62051]